MKSLFYLLFCCISIVNLSAQNITLYGLQSSGNSLSSPMNLVEINLTSGVVSPLFTINNSSTVAAGSSTYDHASSTFIYWGTSTQQEYQLFSVNVNDQNTQNNPSTTSHPIELEFDLETEMTYGLSYDSATNTEYLVTVDLQDGSSQNIATLPGVTGVSVGSSTFDSNNKRYIFHGVDNSFNYRLYTVDVLSGQVLSSPIINDSDSIVNFFEYDNQKDKLYGLYSEVDSSLYDSYMQMHYRNSYLAEVDIATGDATILSATPILGGYFSGIQIDGIAYDQATGIYILRGSDDTGFKLIAINSSNGNVITSTPSDGVIRELQVDNISFATAFYITSSNEENEQLQDIQIFPNPVSKQLNIKIAGLETTALNIQIMDVLGKVVYQDRRDLSSSNKNIIIPTANLASGNYFISLVSEEGTVRTEKFIKE